MIDFAWMLALSNENHDPRNGQFASGLSGGTGGILSGGMSKNLPTDRVIDIVAGALGRPGLDVRGLDDGKTLWWASGGYSTHQDMAKALGLDFAKCKKIWLGKMGDGTIQAIAHEPQGQIKTVVDAVKKWNASKPKRMTASTDNSMDTALLLSMYAPEPTEQRGCRWAAVYDIGLELYNPYHGPDGRFSSAEGAGGTATSIGGRTVHVLAPKAGATPAEAAEHHKALADFHEGRSARLAAKGDTEGAAYHKTLASVHRVNAVVQGRAATNAAKPPTTTEAKTETPAAENKLGFDPHAGGDRWHWTTHQSVVHELTRTGGAPEQRFELVAKLADEHAASYRSAAAGHASRGENADIDVKNKIAEGLDREAAYARSAPMQALSEADAKNAAYARSAVNPPPSTASQPTAKPGDVKTGRAEAASEVKPAESSSKTHHLELEHVGGRDAINKPWVAKITGTDPKFGMKREFINGNKDYAGANSKGTRGVRLPLRSSRGAL